MACAGGSETNDAWANSSATLCECCTCVELVLEGEDRVLEPGVARWQGRRQLVAAHDHVRLRTMMPHELRSGSALCVQSDNWEEDWLSSSGTSGWVQPGLGAVALPCSKVTCCVRHTIQLLALVAEDVVTVAC
jgi:hypothetical protein